MQELECWFVRYPRIMFCKLLGGDVAYGGTFSGSVADRGAGSSGNYYAEKDHDKGLAMNFRI